MVMGNSAAKHKLWAFKYLVSILVSICMLLSGAPNALALTGSQEIYLGSTFYKDIKETLEALNASYPSLTSLQSIGTTLCGRDITAIKVGRGNTEIFINGAHHAREYITAILILDQIEFLLNAYTSNLLVDGYNIQNLLDQVSIWFVPLVNPDGVELCKTGTLSLTDPASLSSLFPADGDFSTWKANARGVDLNRNYDARWAGISDAVAAPSASAYPGTEPFSEEETRAVRDFCLQHLFEAAVSYHSSGEVIYWYFSQKTAQDEERDLEIARGLAGITGYSVVGKQQETVSGGFKDWFIERFGKPSYTIEVGTGASVKPLDFSEYQEIYKDNMLVPAYLANEVLSRLNRKSSAPAGPAAAPTPAPVQPEPAAPAPPVTQAPSETETASGPGTATAQNETGANDGTAPAADQGSAASGNNPQKSSHKPLWLILSAAAASLCLSSILYLRFKHKK